MKVIYPPKYEVTRGDGFKCKFFLAGTIEMGNSEDWQSEMITSLEDKDVIIFNPRRTDWDSSWEQSIDNKDFFEQVSWELDHIEKADIVVMYFDASSKSPISLLELGILTAYPNKVIVCCPEGFWRKGNVDVVCQRYNIKTVDSKEELIEEILSIDFNRKKIT